MSDKEEQPQQQQCGSPFFCQSRSLEMKQTMTTSVESSSASPLHLSTTAKAASDLDRTQGTIRKLSTTTTESKRTHDDMLLLLCTDNNNRLNNCTSITYESVALMQQHHDHHHHHHQDQKCLDSTNGSIPQNQERKHHLPPQHHFVEPWIIRPKALRLNNLCDIQILLDHLSALTTTTTTAVLDDDECNRKEASESPSIFPTTLARSVTNAHPDDQPKHYAEATDRCDRHTAAMDTFIASLLKNSTTFLPSPLVEDQRMISPKSAIQSIKIVRHNLLLELVHSNGDTHTPQFQKYLSALRSYYCCEQQQLQRYHGCNRQHGTWVNVAKSLFPECLGRNDKGDPLYTLSRLSGFPPNDGGDGCNDVICSIQQTFNSIRPIPHEAYHTVPEFVMAAHQEFVDQLRIITMALHPGPPSIQDNSALNFYDIETSFTVETFVSNGVNSGITPTVEYSSASSSSCIQGILKFTGYSLPDPVTAHRHIVWLTRGHILTTNQRHLETIQRLLVLNDVDDNNDTDRSGMGLSPSTAIIVDGGICDTNASSFAYQLHFGGPGMAHVDTLYLDETLRIVQGHRGSLFVFTAFTKVPVPEDTDRR